MNDENNSNNILLIVNENSWIYSDEMTKSMFYKMSKSNVYKILFSSLAKIFVTTMRRLVSAIISLFNYISYIKKALYIRLKIIITIILVELKHNFKQHKKKQHNY